MAEILILGAGFGGLEAATALSERLGPEHQITLVDKSDHFIIGFSKFEVMFGRQSAEQVKSYYRDLAPAHVNFIQEQIEEIDAPRRRVRTRTQTLGYDYLIVALGAEVAPQLTPGLAEHGDEFYTLLGAERTHRRLDSFEGGTIVLSILGAPYKCPPAPFEAAFQLHDYFSRRGIRERVTIKMLTPAAAALPVAPGAAEQITRLFAERNIELYTRHRVTSLDGDHQQAIIAGRDPIDFDLFIGVPLHRAPQVVRDSLLGNGSWIEVNRDNLETSFENVYAVGDVTTIPVGEMAVPKAGAFAEDGAKVVVSDIVHKIKGGAAPQKFKAIGTCYLEFGDGNVAQISANYLGEESPQVALEQPTAASRADKEQFEDERLARWFGKG